MKKLTREALCEIRQSLKQPMSMRDVHGKDIQVIVGMGTCGIAAGAKEVFNAFVDELEAHGMMNVLIRQTGCMCRCQSEPMVEVIAPDLPVVVYGKVDVATVKAIVEQHLIKKEILEEKVCDKPKVSE